MMYFIYDLSTHLGLILQRAYHIISVISATANHKMHSCKHCPCSDSHSELLQVFWTGYQLRMPEVNL